MTIWQIINGGCGYDMAKQIMYFFFLLFSNSGSTTSCHIISKEQASTQGTLIKSD